MDKSYRTYSSDRTVCILSEPLIQERPTMPESPTKSPRERLIDAAIRLFEEQGIRATGIDQLLAEAGVAKMSLYKHFGGKDGLVVASLRRRDELFRETFLAMVETRHGARARVLGVFDALEKWFCRPGFRGCLFLNAAAELPEGGCEARRAIAEHKGWVRGRLGELACGAGGDEELADQLMLLFEGAIARAYVTGDPTVAREARNAAAVLLDAEGS